MSKEEKNKEGDMGMKQTQGMKSSTTDRSLS